MLVHTSPAPRISNHDESTRGRDYGFVWFCIPTIILIEKLFRKEANIIQIAVKPMSPGFLREAAKKIFFYWPGHYEGRPGGGGVRARPLRKK